MLICTHFHTGHADGVDDAQARCPELVLLPANPDRDARELRAEKRERKQEKAREKQERKALQKARNEASRQLARDKKRQKQDQME